MTKLYIIRHAEAEGNLYRRGQGHFDGEVTPQGYLQIQALAERFKDISIDALYSSDLSRTIATAGAITKHSSVEIRQTPALRELYMGAWEDRAWGDLEYENPAQMYNFNSDPVNWVIPEAERVADLAQRMTAAVEAIANAHINKTVAIVSHGMAIRVLLCILRGYGLNQIGEIHHSDNTAVSLIEYDGENFNIVFMNDNSHLSDEISTLAKQSWWRNERGTDIENLRFVPIDLSAERRFYIDCYADTWIQSNGSLDGFEPEYCYMRAAEHCSEYPEALMRAMAGDEPAGVIELSPKRGEAEGYGWITLCYMLPEFRSRGLGVQLIGHAVSFFRKLGRSAVRLHVTETNIRAIRFYERHGFMAIGAELTARSRLILMEKKI